MSWGHPERVRGGTTLNPASEAVLYHEGAEGQFTSDGNQLPAL